MNQALEGTTANMQPALKNAALKKKAEEAKETVDALEGAKQQNQNPEGTIDVGKTEEEDNQRSIALLWSKMTNLKKIILIGSIVLAIIIIAMVTLLIVALSYKPKVEFRKEATLPMPNSNERLNFYEVQGSKQNLIGPNKNKTFAMTTIDTATARMMQQGTTEDVRATAIILQFDHPQAGVSIKATGKDSLIVHVDYDQMIASYSDKRLLFEVEMRAAFRRLQEETSAPSNSDESVAILKEAESSLIKAVASATGTSPSDLILESSETITIAQMHDGTYIPEQNVKNSRLLWALNSLRGLQQYEGIFDKINNEVLKPKIEEAKSTINEFVVNPESIQTITNPEVKAAFQNSNFASNVEIYVSNDNGATSASRLLQKGQKANGNAANNRPNPTPPPAPRPVTNNPPPAPRPVTNNPPPAPRPVTNNPPPAKPTPTNPPSPKPVVNNPPANNNGGKPPANTKPTDNSKPPANNGNNNVKPPNNGNNGKPPANNGNQNQGNNNGIKPKPDKDKPKPNNNQPGNNGIKPKPNPISFPLPLPLPKPLPKPNPKPVNNSTKLNITDSGSNNPNCQPPGPEIKFEPMPISQSCKDPKNTNPPPKIKTVSQSAFHSATQCVGPVIKRKCNMKLFGCSSTPYVISPIVDQKKIVPNGNRYTITINSSKECNQTSTKPPVKPPATPPKNQPKKNTTNLSTDKDKNKKNETKPKDVPSIPKETSSKDSTVTTNPKPQEKLKVEEIKPKTDPTPKTDSTPKIDTTPKIMPDVRPREESIPQPVIPELPPINSQPVTPPIPTFTPPPEIRTQPATTQPQTPKQTPQPQPQPQPQSQSQSQPQPQPQPQPLPPSSPTQSPSAQPSKQTPSKETPAEKPVPVEPSKNTTISNKQSQDNEQADTYKTESNSTLITSPSNSTTPSNTTRSQDSKNQATQLVNSSTP